MSESQNSKNEDSGNINREDFEENEEDMEIEENENNEEMNENEDIIEQGLDKSIEVGEVKEKEKEITEKEKYYYLAQLYEKAAHYKEMFDIIEKLIKTDPQLSKEERKFITLAYKSALNPKRNSWFTVNNLEKKEDQQKIKNYHKEVKNTIEQEIESICNKVINLLDEYLIPNSPNNESKVYYLLMKGDYLRYLCEIAKDKKLKELIENASQCYEKSLENCKYMNILNPTKLSLALNYSVFLYEIKKNKKEGITLSRKMYEDAVNCIERKKETCNIENFIQKDSLFIIQLIKENYIFWSGEMEDEES